MSQGPSITNLQTLRAFAALNVVIFHCIGTSLAHGYALPVFGRLEGWGANGVDIFFVISGFVMVYTQWSRPRHPYNFALNRILRIAPIYWLLTLLYLLLTAFMPSSVINSTAAPPTYVLSSLLFMSGIVSQSWPLLYVGWTIEYEMAFYAIFAVSIYLKSPALRLFFLGIGILGLMIFLPYTAIALEFLFGALLGALYLRGVKIGYPAIVGGIGACLLLATIGFEVSDIARPVIWGIPALLIVIAALYLPQTKQKFLTVLGDASYSIYLAQVFTITATYKVFSALGLKENGDLLMIVAVIRSTIRGLAAYYLLERPITRWIRGINPQFAREPLYPLNK